LAIGIPAAAIVVIASGRADLPVRKEVRTAAFDPKRTRP
jgi:hypothetical protein